ncbi:MAG: type II toxin-antitoxin system HicA family toxin [Gammaproteobacteria bacterium]|nr:type II toxin-antitoxin system HicA family toxin [Gammaproteobacteria bacterium]
MGKTEKLLEKARRHPENLDFGDFETLLGRLGWAMDRQAGSHRLWISPKGARLPIQPRGAQAKSYQIKQFLRIHDEESDNE